MRVFVYEGSRKVGMIIGAKFNITHTEVEGDFDGSLPFQEGQQLRPLQVWKNGKVEMVQCFVQTHPGRFSTIMLRGVSAASAAKKKINVRL